MTSFTNLIWLLTQIIVGILVFYVLKKKVDKSIILSTITNSALL